MPSEQLTVEDCNMNSARGLLRRENIPKKEKQRMNKSVGDDDTDLLNYSDGQYFHESHL